MENFAIILPIKNLNCTPSRLWNFNNWTKNFQGLRCGRKCQKNKHTANMDNTNSALLVIIEGPVWYNIYHQLPIVKGC